MKSNLPSHVQEWFNRAGDDELSIRALLKDQDGAPSTVCFLSQQMAEKYFKALITFTKQPFRKAHDLVELASLSLKELNIENPDLISSANYLNRFYIEARYPGDYPEFTWQEANEAFENAEQVKRLVTELMN